MPKKWYGGKRQANTGSAGALARNEREARNRYSVKKFEIERAEHARAGEGARAPSTNRLVPSDRLFGQIKIYMIIKIIEKGFGFHVQAVKPVNPVW